MHRFFALSASVAVILICSSEAANAQAVSGGTFSAPTNADPLNDPNPVAASTDTRATRLGRGSRPARPVPQPSSLSGPDLLAAAQAVATSAATNCNVSEALLLGTNAEQQPIYEATCASGPGYILLGTTPPQAVDCVILAGQADLSRSRQPDVDVVMQCKMPANTDPAKVVRTYALEAGIACTVDQGASIGRSTSGNFIYEVGCSGADGFWLEKTASGWERTSCLQVLTQNANCRFTQPAEQAATMKTLLAGSEAEACDVTRARYMGGNANGAFYEAKCASGEGYIARFDNAQVVQQIYPCSDAARIGGGCKLTAVADARPQVTPTPTGS